MATLLISEETNKKFKQAVFDRYGMKRGNIMKATEEAIEEWIKNDRKKK